jgi:Ca-activated chloride channel family protein
VRLKGKRAGGEFSREIPVKFSTSTPPFDALAGFWARRQIDDLMSQDWQGLQSGSMKPALQKQITQLGLDYRLMTQFTSFVAVEEKIVTTGGQPHTVQVPVEMPEGVDYKHVFGEDKDQMVFAQGASLSVSAQMGSVGKLSRPMPMAQPAYSVGVAGGVGAGVASNAAPPPPVKSPTSRVEAEVGSVPKESVAPPSSPQRQLLESKLQPALLKILDCRSKSGHASKACTVAQPDKIEVQVWLTQDNDAIRDQLKLLGFELIAEKASARMLVGRLAIDKLEALAQLQQVRFVSLKRA